MLLPYDAESWAPEGRVNVKKRGLTGAAVSRRYN